MYIKLDCFYLSVFDFEQKATEMLKHVLLFTEKKHRDEDKLPSSRKTFPPKILQPCSIEKLFVDCMFKNRI